MSRIVDRGLTLLACTIVLAGLIAARPLPQPPRVNPAQAPAIPPLVEPPRSGRLLPASGSRQQLPLILAAPPVAPAKPLRVPILDSVKGAAASAAKVPLAPARIPGDGPAMAGTLVWQTERLDLYVGSRTFSAEEVAALAPLLEKLLRASERRFGTTLKHRVSIGFYRTPPSRGVRGMAYTEEGRAEIYYRPEESIDRAATVTVHELGHHLEAQRYGEVVQRRADTILHEGMATWIVGERWLSMCGGSTWRERAQQLQNAGIPLRLPTAERSGANNAYEMWASFVDFLVKHYGWEQVDALYRSSRGRAPGSADYQGVLGKSLDELADDWRAWVGD